MSTKFKYEKLRASANKSCKRRGHSMRRFIKSRHSTEFPNDSWGESECKTCGASIRIETKPAPNSCEIHGTAVSMNCGGDSK